MSLTLRPVGGSNISMRNLFLGNEPNVLIEFGLNEDEELDTRIDATGPTSVEDLAEVLEDLARTLRDGVVNP